MTGLILRHTAKPRVAKSSWVGIRVKYKVIGGVDRKPNLEASRYGIVCFGCIFFYVYGIQIVVGYVDGGRLRFDQHELEMVLRCKVTIESRLVT